MRDKVRKAVRTVQVICPVAPESILFPLLHSPVVLQWEVLAEQRQEEGRGRSLAPFSPSPDEFLAVTGGLTSLQAALSVVPALGSMLL